MRITVVDDASTDDTPAVREEFPTVQWERWDENRGQVSARNHMMLSAGEAYYVSLDDDAWFLENDEVEIAVDYLERHPNVAIVAFDILTADRPTKVARGVEQKVPLFIGCGHVARLSAVKAIGGYAHLPGIYGSEETDLSLRLIDAGAELVLLPGVHVWHDKTPTARDRHRQHRSGVRNDMILTLWRFPGSLVLLALAWKLVAHLRFAAKHRLMEPCVEGLSDFFAAAAPAWRKREPVRLASIQKYYSLVRSNQSIRTL